MVKKLSDFPKNKIKNRHFDDFLSGRSGACLDKQKIKSIKTRIYKLRFYDFLNCLSSY